MVLELRLLSVPRASICAPQRRPQDIRLDPSVEVAARWPDSSADEGPKGLKMDLVSEHRRPKVRGTTDLKRV